MLPPAHKRRTRARRPNRGKLQRRHAPFAVAASSARLDRDTPLATPLCFAAAMQSPACDLWREAMNAELLELGMHGTYSVEQVLAGREKVGSKWVFKVKRDGKGNVVELKACLVATGCSQKAHIDYVELFAPVGKCSIFRVFNVYFAGKGFKRCGFDVPSAYLKGDALEEVVNTRPLPGHACAPGTVWRLLRPLYGLKQALRACAFALRKELESWHMLGADADCTLYIKEGSDGPVLMATNVDDFDLAGSDRDMDPMQARLRTYFSVRRTADDAPFVGMQRVANPITGAMTIHQQRYVEELLVEFGMTQAKPVNTPSESGVELRRDAPGDTALPPAVPYAQVVGKLMFLAGCTRPDVMQPVAALGLRYHGPQVNVADCSATGELHIEGFADANYAGCKDTLCSTTSQVLRMNGAAVSWSSTLQPTVAQYTTKAEYMAAAVA
jgi:hypothetical protein